MRSTAAIVACSLAMLALAGCGNDDDADRAATAPSTATTGEPRQTDAPGSGGPVGTEPGGEVTELGSRDPDNIDDEAPDSFNAAKTEPEREEPAKGFNAVLNSLAIRKPPLPIQQYVSEQAKRKITARPDPRVSSAGAPCANADSSPGRFTARSRRECARRASAIRRGDLGVERDSTRRSWPGCATAAWC